MQIRYNKLIDRLTTYHKEKLRFIHKKLYGFIPKSYNKEQLALSIFRYGDSARVWRKISNGN